MKLKEIARGAFVLGLLFVGVGRLGLSLPRQVAPLACGAEGG
jgi:hypothetical protein